MTLGTYFGVGTFYELDLSEDGTTLRLLVHGGGGGSVIAERPNSIDNQRELGVLMVNTAVAEVVAEMAYSGRR